MALERFTKSDAAADGSATAIISSAHRRVMPSASARQLKWITPIWLANLVAARSNATKPGPFPDLSIDGAAADAVSTRSKGMDLVSQKSRTDPELASISPPTLGASTSSMPRREPISDD